MAKSDESQISEIQLLEILQTRFEQNQHRHPNLHWEDIAGRLKSQPKKLRSLIQMEQSFGEPDVIGQDPKTGEYLFCDCATESPKGRRSFCYDAEAQKARKEHAPQNNAIESAKEMGIELLTENQYRALQELGEFDLKTSSWIQTPESIRKLGGALFCDRRYDQVFTYHNGAQSYYAARGYRGLLKV